MGERGGGIWINVENDAKAERSSVNLLNKSYLGSYMKVEANANAYCLGKLPN
jgi:hypothetical protein